MSHKPFMKNSAGKPSMVFLPWQELEDVARVENHGAQKYERGNWQKGTPEDYLDAALRHISARLQGRYLDDEGPDPSRLPHLAHAICSLLFAMWLDRRLQRRQGILRHPMPRSTWPGALSGCVSKTMKEKENQ